jgi:hypothetical protein
MGEGGGQLVEPGARNLLALQAVQTVQRAGGDLGMRWCVSIVLAHPGAEIHQATAEPEQYGGQAGCGNGQGFGVRHINVPEITTRLCVAGDSCMTLM